jgi:hypothetical protein
VKKCPFAGVSSVQMIQPADGPLIVKQCINNQNLEITGPGIYPER